MPTPAQEFEQLLDRYRFTEGLCAPDAAAADDSAPDGAGEGNLLPFRAAPGGSQKMRVCGVISRYGQRP